MPETHEQMVARMERMRAARKAKAEAKTTYPLGIRKEFVEDFADAIAESVLSSVEPPPDGSQIPEVQDLGLDGNQRLELKAGEVEQSNCIARGMHDHIARMSQRCPHCGYPGEWTGGQSKATSSPIPHVVGERMEAPRALALALGHLSAMLEMTAGKNANETPTEQFCQICDGQNEHAGNGSLCPCACHEARAFLVSQQGAYL